MGQKTNPIGFRAGITEEWQSRWYAPKANYGEFLVEDQKIRNYVDERLNRQPPYAAVSRVHIERNRDEVKVILYTARPGLVIGPKGAEVDKLKDALEELIDRKINLNIVEVKAPDLNAQLVGEAISEQLKKRTAFRRAMKQRLDATMAAGAKGIKIQLSGRLGGREMAACESMQRGSLPMQTLQAHVDYGYAICRTTYGTIGVKVWVYLGRYGEEIEAVVVDSGRKQRRGKL
ncbi:MAG: 30S ribosomal protein S3 [Phycisphaerae bacterium]|nr:30S ribosomal protein S3 [Phycisphaerae bacterium]